MQKTVVGSYDLLRSAQSVAHELHANGFRESEISVIASTVASDGVPDNDSFSNVATGAVTGGLVGGTAGLVLGMLGLALPGLGPVLAAGPLVAALTGAGAGAAAGGLVGALTGEGVPEEHALYYAEAVRRGGALVAVRTEEVRADRAAEIIRAHGGIDIEERASRWREAGWTGSDTLTPPYTKEEAERERRHYGTHADPLTGLPSTTDPEGDNRRDSTIRH